MLNRGRPEDVPVRGFRRSELLDLVFTMLRSPEMRELMERARNGTLALDEYDGEIRHTVNPSGDEPFLTVSFPDFAPDWETPKRDIPEVWISGLGPRKQRLINKHVHLAVLETLKNLVLIDSLGEGGDRTLIHFFLEWAGLDVYCGKIDVEGLFCNIRGVDLGVDEIDKHIASFQRIIAHLRRIREDDPSC